MNILINNYNQSRFTASLFIQFSLSNNLQNVQSSLVKWVKEM